MMLLFTLLLVTLAAVPGLSKAPTFTADVSGNLVIATASNASLVVNGVDILATLLSLQTTVAAQQDAIAMLTLNNTLLEAELAAFQVRGRSSYLTLSSKQK